LADAADADDAAARAQAFLTPLRAALDALGQVPAGAALD